MNLMELVQTYRVEPFKGSFYFFWQGPYRGLYCSEKERIIIPPEYSRIIPQKDHIRVGRDGKWGLYVKGELAIPPQYDWVQHFRKNIWKVRSGRQWGLFSLDRRIECLCPLYEEITLFPRNSDYFLIRQNDKLGVAMLNSQTGEVTVILPVEYSTFAQVRGRTYLMSKEGRHGLFFATGEWRFLFPVQI